MLHLASVLALVLLWIHHRERMGCGVPATPFTPHHAEREAPVCGDNRVPWRWCLSAIRDAFL